MIRLLNIILCATCLVSFVGVYALKYQTVDTANEKMALADKIEKQQNDLSLLKADWAYLNQPSYIEPIIERHADILNLQIAQKDQFIKISDLPMRHNEPDSAALTELLQSLEAGVDPIGELIKATDQ